MNCTITIPGGLISARISVSGRENLAATISVLGKGFQDLEMLSTFLFRANNL